MSDATAPYSFSNPRLESIASGILAAKEYEGDGRILHDSYDKSAYTKRRHGFLGRHPDSKTNPKLHLNVTGDADQVFNAQPNELSVEQVRIRELFCEIQPLLPFPTSTNTETLDNFRSFGTKEWTAETGHPTHFPPFPQSPSPIIQAAKPTIEDRISPEQIPFTPLGPGGSVSGERTEDSNVGHSMRQHQQTVSAGPDQEYPGQQTGANMAFHSPSNNSSNRNSQAPRPGAMDPPQVALNVPADAATMRKIVQDLGKKSLTPADQPEQYRQMHRPQLQVSAVAGRGLSTPVKPPPQHGTKRAAPVDLDEADVEVSGEDQPANLHPKRHARPAAKKAKVIVTAGEDQEVPKKEARRHATKAPRQAPPVAAPKPKAKGKGKGKGRAAPNDSSVASTVSDMRPVRASQRPTIGGKAPPQQSGSAAPATVSRRASHPATVIGTRLPRSRTEAAEAAVERRQALLTALLDKKRTVRHPDLGPEFFDTANFTADEKDPDGEPPVRCVCEANGDDSMYMGAWIGCDNDECRVWQHVPCMGEGVPPENARETSKYLCQQCDPWVHRRLIQTLRKKQPLTTE